MQMGMMDGTIPQQNQMIAQMPGQGPDFPPQYQQFQNRSEFGRNQFYGPDGGFRSNGLRPDGFGQPFSQSQSPQVNKYFPLNSNSLDSSCIIMLHIPKLCFEWISPMMQKWIFFIYISNSVQYVAMRL